MFQKFSHFFNRIFSRVKNNDDVKCDSFVVGWIYYFSSKEELSVILEKGGVNNSVGGWAIELTDYPSRFKIAYVGNLSPDEPFDIEGDGYNVEIRSLPHAGDLAVRSLMGLLSRRMPEARKFESPTKIISKIGK